MGLTFPVTPDTTDPSGTSMRPFRLAGAMLVASSRSPGREILEPVAVDNRASRVVPAGKSCAETGRENTRMITARQGGRTALEHVQNDHEGAMLGLFTF